jgi:hypothetical protein
VWGGPRGGALHFSSFRDGMGWDGVGTEVKAWSVNGCGRARLSRIFGVGRIYCGLGRIFTLPTLFAHTSTYIALWAETQVDGRIYIHSSTSSAPSLSLRTLLLVPRPSSPLPLPSLRSICANNNFLSQNAAHTCGYHIYTRCRDQGEGEGSDDQYECGCGCGDEREWEYRQGGGEVHLFPVFFSFLEGAHTSPFSACIDVYTMSSVFLSLSPLRIYPYTYVSDDTLFTEPSLVHILHLHLRLQELRGMRVRRGGEF